ncbi:CDP-glycerol glycerophosphotransferase family protein [Nocardioides mesophilus]|uniref:CDP-glycerol glycerophosphotransferase family protein n=1 Tax=Nocardioides mesophilus TaxID=433659 RepID=A0A7G9REL3_9ACTN|nr:CDP-glycerol glycerophosphotransferase family protein [Nocardioides mesophilus]QNN54038.1 CDP-glycerol glycerophosphotransferase family protein [Nocardioides mesophilus]
MNIVDAKLAVLRTCLKYAPALNHAVVSGAPDDEGNSVEVVRALARHMRVYWLVSDDPAQLRWLIADAEKAETVRCLPKESRRAYWAYLTASLVFFTHGLYGSPKPPPHKTFVNLWHGDGPKRRTNFAQIRSTMVVSGTHLWGSRRAASFGVEPKNVIISGNPRVDQFARPVGDASLTALGIRPEAPFILWLPTYRSTEYKGRRLGEVRDWSDAEEISRSARARALLARVAELAERSGVTLAVKPHHLDADKFADLGMRVITNADLRESQVNLYQLLARAHGLITDYSSVWTDFLATDRPIGFYCPDIDDYTASRGLNVDDYPSLLPGPLLETPEDFDRFLHDCKDEPAASRAKRRRSIEMIGAQMSPGATNRLLRALGISPDANG